MLWIWAIMKFKNRDCILKRAKIQTKLTYCHKISKWMLLISGNKKICQKLRISKSLKLLAIGLTLRLIKEQSILLVVRQNEFKSKPALICQKGLLLLKSPLHYFKMQNLKFLFPDWLLQIPSLITLKFLSLKMNLKTMDKCLLLFDFEQCKIVFTVS